MCNYRPQTKLREGYVFTGVCDSVNKGGMCGCGGHAWLPGVCVVVGGCTWLWGACMVAGGVCIVAGGGGMHRTRRDTVNKRAVRSYWNAFLCNLNVFLFPNLWTEIDIFSVKYANMNEKSFRACPWVVQYMYCSNQGAYRNGTSVKFAHLGGGISWKENVTLYLRKAQLDPSFILIL